MWKSAIVGLFVAVVVPEQIRALGPESRVERSVQAITHDYMSPYCPGFLLANCSSPAAGALRSEITARLQAGTSEADVREELDRRFGEALRASPTFGGFGLLAWLLPPAFLVAGAIVVGRWMSLHRACEPNSVGVPDDESHDPDLLSKLESELRSVSM